MPTVLQFRRGSTAQNNSFTGSDGELSLDTDLYTIRVHDGSTAGGFEITQNTATQTLTNKTADALTLTGTLTANAGVGSSGQYLESTGTGVRWSTVDATTIENGTSNVVVATDSDVTVSRAGALLATFGTAGLTMASGGFVGDLTGNADTATALSSAVTVELTGPVTGSATFTSAGDTASISTTLTADPTITLTGAVTGSATMTNLGNVSIATTATSDPTITLTGAVTGSGTLTNLGDVTITTTNTADPTITLAGDLSGSATLTNLGSATLTATIVANSVALGTDTTGNYVATGAVSGVGLSGSSSSEGGTFTVTSNATSSNTGSTIVARDGSGNFTAGTITATLSGTATNATNVYVNNDDTGDTNCPILFSANSTAGYKPIYEDSSFYFDNTNNILYTTANAARYADLAEKYTSDIQYPPGTVVVLGGEAEVTRSPGPTSRAIAGIVSTDPAYLMNTYLEGECVVDVALIGRVPCMVTGIINKGDLLVSSSRPGHACAWTNATNPPAGSIVGKAIENKTDEDPGVIEVLVGRL